MKINRYFPPYSNCFSRLLILECSCKSYLPLRAHLSFKFFSHSVVALSSPHPCDIPDFDSLGFIQGFCARSYYRLPGSECVVNPKPASFHELLLSLPDSFLKAPVAYQAEYQPLLLEDHFAPMHSVLLNRELIEVKTSGIFQLDPWDHFGYFSCFFSASIMTLALSIYEMLPTPDLRTQHSNLP